MERGIGTVQGMDGIPSQMLKIMEKIEKYDKSGEKRIYALVNMGFYESSQIKNLLGMVKSWSAECGFEIFKKPGTMRFRAFSFLKFTTSMV